VILAPPAAGTDGGMIFTIGGGDTYCVRFGGPAGGIVKNTPRVGSSAFQKSFKIRSTAFRVPHEAGCPSLSTCSLATTWGINGEGPGEFDNPSGIAHLPGVGLYVSDENNHRIQLFDPDGMFITEWGVKGFLPGTFNRVSGVAVDNVSLSVYAAERGNHRIQKFDSAGTFLTTWGSLCDLSTGSGCTDPDGGGPLQLGDGEFNEPSAVAVDATGNVYVADTDNHRIQKFDSTGTFITKWGSRCRLTNGSGCVDPDGAGALEAGDGQFDMPSDIAVDAAGNVYIADEDNHRIQKFDSTGTFLIKWGTECFVEKGAGVCVDPDGAGPLEFGDGQFVEPSAIAVGGGSVYVADRNGRIQKFDLTGALLGKWGGRGEGPGQLERPSGLTVDATGNIYTVDRADRVQKFAPSCP